MRFVETTGQKLEAAPLYDDLLSLSTKTLCCAFLLWRRENSAWRITSNDVELR
jgi:hypothetical protein